MRAMIRNSVVFMYSIYRSSVACRIVGLQWDSDKNKNIVIYEIKSLLLTHILSSRDQPRALVLFVNNRVAIMGDNSGDSMIDSGSSSSSHSSSGEVANTGTA